MRKLFWQVSMTLDGFMEGPGEYNLAQTAEYRDPDFEKYATDMLKNIDGMLLGRKTYEMFLQYWPTAEGEDADNMNRLPKYIFSKTLANVAWDNAELATGDAAAYVTKLKEQGDGELAIFGSADLAASLGKLGLIDEYRVFTTPFAVGGGGKAFKNDELVSLDLVKAEAWSAGTLALYYKPKELNNVLR